MVKNFICINFAKILITFSGNKMSMKKVIILVVLLLTTMAHTAFAEQRGVFMEFHRKINPGKNMHRGKLAEIKFCPSIEETTAEVMKALEA